VRTLNRKKEADDDEEGLLGQHQQLLPTKKKNNNPPTTTPAPKAAGGSVRGEFFSKVPPRSAAPPRKLPLDKTIEYESLREDINMEKQTVRLLFFCRSFFFRCTLVGAPTTLCVSSGPPQLHNYEQREEHTKAALASLLDHTGEEESKVWYCAGDFFIRLPMDKAKGLAQQELDVAAQAAEQTRERIKYKTLEVEELTAK